MREIHDGRCAVLFAAVATLISAAVPLTTAGAVPDGPPTGVRACSRVPEARSRPPGAGRPPSRPTVAANTDYSWTDEIDVSGWLRGHTLTLGTAGSWRAGPRA